MTDNHKIATTEVLQSQAPQKICRRIGSTTYEVYVHFSKTSRESMYDKIVRLIKNEAANGKAVGQ